MRIFNVKTFDVFLSEPVDQRAWIALKMCPAVRPGAPSPTVHAMPKECVVRAQFWDIGIVPSADVPDFGVFLVLAECFVHVGQETGRADNVVLHHDDTRVLGQNVGYAFCDGAGQPDILVSAM